jgi:hypothetical protein
MPDHEFNKLWIDNAELRMLQKYKAIAQKDDPMFQGKTREYYEKVLARKLETHKTMFDHWDKNPDQVYQ